MKDRVQHIGNKRDMDTINPLKQIIQKKGEEFWKHTQNNTERLTKLSPSLS